MKQPPIRSAASVFVDSGAFSLYTAKVKSTKPQDFSFYSLAKGSEFRAYCDAYARFMKKVGKRALLANVDVIYNPDLTWEVQRFFEEEHGVQPVPIVHYRTPMKYVDRYLEAGRYRLLGVGGFAWGGPDTTKWLDAFFLHICPAPAYLPIIKVHGFALTSWRAVCRWPWWSVDSTTWFTTAAFGGIYVPRVSQKGGWRYDRPPFVIQVSDRSTSKSVLGRHYHSLSKMEKRQILDWLESLGSGLQEVTGEGNKIGRGEDPSYIARSFVNLSYFKNLEESRPPWPTPLDIQIVRSDYSHHHRGFGL
jgi:hypothetical protein